MSPCCAAQRGAAIVEYCAVSTPPVEYFGGHPQPSPPESRREKSLLDVIVTVVWVLTDIIGSASLKAGLSVCHGS